VPKIVIIGAPHTSNWDFIGGIGAMLALGLDFGWLGKHTLFRRPCGWFMRLLGGIAIDRDDASGVVASSAEAFRLRDRLWLALAPEGTRRGGTWKSGFYRIARAAGVPILLVVIDTGPRRIEIGPLLRPGADEDADWERIRAFYEPHLARRGRRLRR
jgi:1-acyl-sn-glycerol-3-phosphate acyltransferase